MGHLISAYLLVSFIFITHSISAEGFKHNKKALKDIIFETGCFDSDEHGPANLAPRAFRWLFYFSKEKRITITYQAFEQEKCEGEALHETYQEYSVGDPHRRVTKRGIFKDYKVEDIESFYFWERRTNAWPARRKLLIKNKCNVKELAPGEVFNLIDNCPEKSLRDKLVLKQPKRYTVSVKNNNETLEIVSTNEKDQKRVAIFIGHSPVYVNKMKGDLTKELFNLNEEIIHSGLQQKYINRTWIGLCMNRPFHNNKNLNSQQYVYILSAVNELKERKLIFEQDNCKGKKYEQQRVFSFIPFNEGSLKYYKINHINHVVYSTNFMEINEKFRPTLDQFKCVFDPKAHYIDLAKKCPSQIMTSLNKKSSDLRFNLTPTTLTFYGKNGKDQDIIKAYSGVY